VNPMRSESKLLAADTESRSPGYTLLESPSLTRATIDPTRTSTCAAAVADFKVSVFVTMSWTVYALFAVKRNAGKRNFVGLSNRR